VRISSPILTLVVKYSCVLAAYYSDSMVNSPFEDYLDLVEAARELGIHPQSLRRLIKQKKIPAVLFAGKYLIERDKLEMFKANYDPRPGRKPIRRLL
jgi:excisionase family DNA binding protein